MTILALKLIHRYLFIVGCFLITFHLAGCSFQKPDPIPPEENHSLVQSVPEQSVSEPQGSEAEPEQDKFVDMSHKELLQIFYQTMKEDCYNPDNQLEKHTSFFMLEKYYSFLIRYDGHTLLNGVQCNNRPGPEQIWGGTLWASIFGEFAHNNYSVTISEITVFDIKEEDLSWPPAEPNTDYYRDLEEKEIGEIEEYLKKIYTCIERPKDEYGCSPWCIVEISDDTFILLACYPWWTSSMEKQESKGSFFVFQKPENSHYQLSSCVFFRHMY